MSLITINFGLVGSNRFGAEARSRVLPENPTAIHGLNIPYITVGITEADLEEVGFRVHCTRYAQDYIAVQDNLGRGALIGTFSHVWGEFNADYFINY